MNKRSDPLQAAVAEEDKPNDTGSEQAERVSLQAELGEDGGSVVEDGVDARPLLEEHDAYRHHDSTKVDSVRDQAEEGVQRWAGGQVPASGEGDRGVKEIRLTICNPRSLPSRIRE
jgi:hypothetical protein